MTISAAAGAAIVALAAPASAHAVLLEATPTQTSVVEASPDSVELHFTEPVGVRFGGIRVFDRDLNRVDEGKVLHSKPNTVAVAVRPLEDGTYIVGWRVISGDSHPVRGAFTFSVGAPSDAAAEDEVLASFGNASPTVVIIGGAARAVGYATAVALFGAVLFLVVVWRPAARDHAAADRAMAAVARRWLLASWLAGVLATVILLVTQAAVEAGAGVGGGLRPSVVGEVLATTFGRVWLVRAALLALMLPLLLHLPHSPATGRSVGALAVTDDATEAGTRLSRPPAWLLLSLLVLTAAVAATPAFWGHASTTEPRLVAVAADALHLLGVSAWMGGLVVLLLIVPRALAGVGDGERAVLTADAVPRFSKVALVSVGVLAATGAWLALIQVTTWQALFSTSYGRVVLGKVALLAAALWFGAMNQRRNVPRLRAAATDASRSRAAGDALRRAVRAEVALTTFVLLLAAALVAIPPPRATGEGGAVATQFDTQVPIGEDTVSVLIIPTRVNQPADAHFTFTTPDGPPDDEIEEVNVELTLRDLGPFRHEGQRLAPGHYVVHGVTFPIAGTWSLRAEARRGEVDVFSTTFDVPVG